MQEGNVGRKCRKEMQEGHEKRNRKLVNSIMEGGRGDGELAEGYDGKKIEDLRRRIGRRV